MTSKPGFVRKKKAYKKYVDKSKSYVQFVLQYDIGE